MNPATQLQSPHFQHFSHEAELPPPFTRLSLVPSTYLALGNHLMNTQLEERNEQLEEQSRQNSSGLGKGGLIYGIKLED